MSLGREARVVRCALALAIGIILWWARPPSARAQAAPNPPTSESDSCANGIDLFAPSTCIISLSGNSDGPVSDGTVIVQLVDPVSSASLACGTPGCLIARGGDEVDLYCGLTAPNGRVASTTCSSVSFQLQSPFSACLSSPATCPRTANINSSSAALNVSFLATPGNGGTGGVILGQDAIGYQGPNTGLLLVTATPQLIPSNGTIASVITATFACGTGSAFNSVRGFPLSSGNAAPTTATGTSLVANQPVLGTGQNAVCGAGLPGGFTFSAPRNLIFDNGRTVEGVGCGVGPTVSPFGGSSPFAPYHSTTPLIFTCTGASVLAIGNGRPGDAPINVVYSSSVGGLTAVGSTLLTASPSPQPVVALTCSPQVIAPGGPGALCTASVTDPNGIALTGLTGATITFTTSDTTNTVLLACGYGPAGNINTATTPPVVPQLAPLTPCQLPTNWIPSQVNLGVNGQATALLVAAGNTAPETVTVSANLNIYLPPSSLCEAAPYLPPYFNPQTTGVGLPSVTGCGSGNPVGFSGAASALSTSTGTVATTIPTNFVLPPSAGASVTIGSSSPILVAGGTASSPAAMTRGCNQMVVTSTAGTPISAILALVDHPENVASIWSFNNTTKQYRSTYFNDPNAPTDFSQTGGTAATQQGSATVAGTGGLAQFTNTALPPGTQVTEAYFMCLVRPVQIPSS